MPFSPQGNEIYVSTPLTNLSIAYIQSASAFVAGRLAGSVPVSKQSDRYVTYPKGAFMRSAMRKRAKGTRATVADFQIDNSQTYFAETYALAKPIADEDRVNQAPPVNLDRDTTVFLTQQGLLQRELEFVNKFFKPGVWSFNRTGVAAAPNASQFLHFTDTASVPIRVIRTIKREMLEATGFEPNKLTLQRGVYDALVDHPEIVDRIKYGQTPGAPAEVNTRTLAQLFEVDEVNVMNAVQNTAAEGSPDAISFIGSKGFLLSYTQERPSIMLPSAFYTFAWTGFLPGQGPNLGEVISRWRDGPARTDYIQSDLAYEMRVVAADMAMFGANAIP
jgi:hypothetical protein